MNIISYILSQTLLIRVLYLMLPLYLLLLVPYMYYQSKLNPKFHLQLSASFKKRELWRNLLVSPGQLTNTELLHICVLICKIAGSIGGSQLTFSLDQFDIDRAGRLVLNKLPIRSDKKTVYTLATCFQSVWNLTKTSMPPKVFKLVRRMHDPNAQLTVPQVILELKQLATTD